MGPDSTQSEASRQDVTRRCLLRGLAAGAALFTVKGAFAAELTRTPWQEEGPYYPDHLPLDTDNDLLVVNDRITPAVGEVTHLSGRILDSSGDPLRGAVVEIWQVDHTGSYIHSHGLNPNAAARDGNFQGFGRFLTGSTGEFYFRTIKPVMYPGRAPHIHFAIKAPRRERFTTQCYVRGDVRNAFDGVLGTVRDPKQREAIVLPFVPVPGSRIGELAARFDIVLGATPGA